jgi:hypothetical protein
MSIEKHTIFNAWIITDIIDGQLIRRTYYGYSKRYAAALFRAEMKRVQP